MSFAPLSADAEAPGDRGSLSRHQLWLLDCARDAAGLTPHVFVDQVVKVLRGVSGLADLDQGHFDLIMDGFVALGFRHPAVPILSAAQLACLDAARCRLGMSGRDYLCFIRHATGVRSPRLMSGTHFLALRAVFGSYGIVAPLSAPGFMDRQRAGTLRKLAWSAGLPDAVFRELLWKFGGVTKVGDLHERAFGRVQARLYQLGAVRPEPAPRVEGAPGMVTHAQANLIWKLWHERGGRAGDVSEAALERGITAALGLPGGLATLTRAGARKMLEAWSA